MDRYDHPSYRFRGHGRGSRSDRTTLWLVGGVGAAMGIAALAAYQALGRNSVAVRPPDDAPGRAARGQSGRRTLTGRTVTIDRPPGVVHAFWRDFSNLAEIMENIREVKVEGDLTRWTVVGPTGRDVMLVTRITEDREGETIAWRSTEASDIAHRGRVSFREAPAGRGTEVSLDLEYAAPGGTLGRWVAKALQAEPHLQARRDLKRLKMFLETGEIATNSNRRDAA